MQKTRLPVVLLMVCLIALAFSIASAGAEPVCPGCGLGEPCPTECGPNSCPCDTGAACVCAEAVDGASGAEPAQVDAAQKLNKCQCGAPCNADEGCEATCPTEEQCRPVVDAVQRDTEVDEAQTGAGAMEDGADGESEDGLLEAKQSAPVDEAAADEDAGSNSSVLVGAGIGLLGLGGILAFFLTRNRRKEENDGDAVQ